MDIETISRDPANDGQTVRYRIKVPAPDKQQLAWQAADRLLRSLDAPMPDDAAQDVAKARTALVEKMGQEQADRGIRSYIAAMAGLDVARRDGIALAFLPEAYHSPTFDVADETDAVIDVEMLPKPTFELSSYEPVHVHVEPTTVTDDMVDERIAQILADSATYTQTGTSAQEGDYLLVNMNTLVNNDYDRNLSGERMVVVLNRGDMPAGFVDNVVGMQIGETRTFDFTASSGKGGPLDAFHVEVMLIDRRRKETPSFTDDFVAEKLDGSYGTTAQQAREKIRADLESEQAEHEAQHREQLAVEELASRLEDPVGDLLIERGARDTKDQLEQALAAQGMTLGQYLKQIGTDERQFQFSIMMQARESLRQGLALDALWRHLGEELTEDDRARAKTELSGADGEAEYDSSLDAPEAQPIVDEMAQRLRADDWLMKTAIFE
jgi:trigger factor